VNICLYDILILTKPNTNEMKSSIKKMSHFTSIYLRLPASFCMQITLGPNESGDKNLSSMNIAITLLLLIMAIFENHGSKYRKLVWKGDKLVWVNNLISFHINENGNMLMRHVH
jgi:hypothetical protein